VSDSYTVFSNTQIMPLLATPFSLPGAGKTKCMARCSQLSNCVILQVKSSLCYVYGANTRYQYITNATGGTTTSTWQKEINGSYPKLYLWTVAYASSLVHYWPIEAGLPNDYVGVADITSGTAFMLGPDRFGRPQRSLRLNRTNTYGAAPATYFNGDMTLTVWWFVRECVDYSGFLIFRGQADVDGVNLATTSGTSCLPFVNIF
jgi:hypothetical protein